MKTLTRIMTTCGVAALFSLTGCGHDASHDASHDGGDGANGTGAAHTSDDHDGGHGDHALADGDRDVDHGDHDHADGDHDGDAHAHDEQGAHDGGGEHAHEEVSIGTMTIDDLAIACWQGHGSIAAGKELHLVVKLPYSDKGATTVRAWIGSEDRMSAVVAKAVYAPSHDDYDVHAEAPAPLPANAMWWVEIEKPDGTRMLGSIAPI